MKSKKGISLVVLTISIVAILIVGAITVLLITRGNNDDTSVEQIGSSTDTNYETEQNNDTINEDTTIKGKFWVDGYKNWGEQKESFTLTLFDGKFTAPIELKSASSFAKKITYYLNGFGGGQSTSNINEVLNSESMIDYDTPVWLHYGELDEYGKYNDGIRVVLENFNEAETSIKDCFNNNWWSITELYNPQEALGIFVDDEEYSERDTRPLLNKVVEVLGGPKHIFTYLKSDGEYKDITYGMYYEYSDFAIEISVMEIDTGNNYMCQIGGITYAPKEYWEKSLEERKEDYNNFEIMK